MPCVLTMSTREEADGWRSAVSIPPIKKSDFYSYSCSKIRQNCNSYSYSRSKFSFPVIDVIIGALPFPIPFEIPRPKQPTSLLSHLQSLILDLRAFEFRIEVGSSDLIDPSYSSFPVPNFSLYCRCLLFNCPLTRPACWRITRRIDPFRTSHFLYEIKGFRVAFR